MDSQEAITLLNAIEAKLDQLGPDRRERNQTGVALRLELAQLKDQLPDDPQIKERLRSVLDRLLKEAFDIDPKGPDREHVFYTVRVTFDANAPLSSTQRARDLIRAVLITLPEVHQVTVRHSPS